MRTKKEPWDGPIRVSGGALVRLEERHFLSRDRIIGGDSWTASTREERIRGFPRVNYYEMSPAELPPTQYSPVGLFAVVSGDGSTNLRVRTQQGNFSCRLDELSDEPKEFLDGRATASLTPTVERLSSERYEDDEPAVVEVSEGLAGVAWVAYRDKGDRVLFRIRRDGAWDSAQDVTPSPADIWRI